MPCSSKRSCAKWSYALPGSLLWLALGCAHGSGAATRTAGSADDCSEAAGHEGGQEPRDGHQRLASSRCAARDRSEKGSAQNANAQDRLTERKARQPQGSPPASATEQQELAIPEGDFSAQVQRSRTLIHELGQKDWTEACLKASEALHGLGFALDVAPTAARQRGPAGGEVHRQATALARACGASFDVADRMQDGLRAALDGIEQVARTGTDAEITSWLKAATAAVDALDRKSGWVFQQPGVQDAFRTVSDVFVVVAQQ